MTPITITRQPAVQTHETPLLFVHGAWHAAWCWDEHFLPYFAEHGYAAHAVNLRGHWDRRGSERLPWYSAADYVEDVAQVAATFSTPPILIGHSMGGFVVQKYLEKYDAPGAVLMASIPTHGMWQLLVRFTRRFPLGTLRLATTLNPWALVGTLERAHHDFFSVDMPREQVAAYYARIQNESMRIAFDATALNLPRPAKVRARRIPMLVLGGANDTIFSVAEQHSTARAYGTEARIIPNMAHDMMLEKGWRDVAEMIRAWIDGLGV